MIPMNELSEQETKELIAYGEGHGVGMQEVINELKSLYAQPGDLTEFGRLVEEMLVGYGVDLDEIEMEPGQLSGIDDEFPAYLDTQS